MTEEDTNRRWFAECGYCCAQGPFCQKEPQVIPAWNKRVADPPFGSVIVRERDLARQACLEGALRRREAWLGPKRDDCNRDAKPALAPSHGSSLDELCARMLAIGAMGGAEGGTNEMRASESGKLRGMGRGAIWEAGDTKTVRIEHGVWTLVPNEKAHLQPPEAEVERKTK